MSKKVLHPQAAGYYKRLILVADRYQLLLKKYSNLRTVLWIVSLIAIIELLVILSNLGLVSF